MGTDDENPIRIRIRHAYCEIYCYDTVYLLIAHKIFKFKKEIYNNSIITLRKMRLDWGPHHLSQDQIKPQSKFEIPLEDFLKDKNQFDSKTWEQIERILFEMI